MQCMRTILRPGPAENAGVLDDANFVQIESLTRWIRCFPPGGSTRVSVVTASRNRPSELARAAESIARQTDHHWEWIVVNDGEPDSLGRALECVPAAKVRVVSSGGIGLAAARNRGLDIATGDYICYLDDDNLLHPEWIRALRYAVQQHPETQWGYGARLVETPEVVTREDPRPDFPALEFPPYSRSRLQVANYLDANTVFHRNGSLRFDERTNSQSDWELVLRLSTEWVPLVVPAIACYYRTSTSNRLSRSPQRFSDTHYIRGVHGLHE